MAAAIHEAEMCIRSLYAKQMISNPKGNLYKLYPYGCIIKAADQPESSDRSGAAGRLRENSGWSARFGGPATREAGAQNGPAPLAPPQSVPDYGANPTATSPIPVGQGGLPGVPPTFIRSVLMQVGKSMFLAASAGRSKPPQRRSRYPQPAVTLRIARETLAAQKDVWTLTPIHHSANCSPKQAMDARSRSFD